jgi:hypothetical protein
MKATIAKSSPRAAKTAAPALILSRRDIDELLPILDFAVASLKSAIDSVLLRGEKWPKNPALRESVRIDRKTMRDARRLMKLLEGAIS